MEEIIVIKAELDTSSMGTDRNHYVILDLQEQFVQKSQVESISRRLPLSQTES
jgi:hypothetical protein